MKDFMGTELEVGDRVVSYHHLGYKQLLWYTVEKFTPKMVRLRYGKREDETVLRDAKEVIAFVIGGKVKVKEGKV